MAPKGLERDGRLLRNRKIRGARAKNSHGMGSFVLRCRTEGQAPGTSVIGGFRKQGAHLPGEFRGETRGQGVTLAFVDHRGDTGDFLRGLSRAEDHLGTAAALATRGIDPRKAKVNDAFPIPARAATHAS